MYIYPIFLKVQIKVQVPLQDFIFIFPSVKNERKMTFKMNKNTKKTTKCIMLEINSI